MTAFVAPKVLGLQLEGQVKNLRTAVRKIGKLLRRDFAYQEERDPIIIQTARAAFATGGASAETRATAFQSYYGSDVRVPS